MSYKSVPYLSFHIRATLCCLTLLVLALQASQTGWGQASSSVNGVVLDPQGATIAGARVSLVGEGTGLSRETVTGAQGGYTFEQVPPGGYSLTVTAAGFETSTRAHLQALIATPTRVDFKLTIGQVGQTVSVQGEAAAVNTEDATMGSAFGENEIKQLPFAARNPVNLLTFEPGIVFTGSSDTDLLSMGSAQDLDPREGAVNGVRGNQSNVTLDGIEANDYQNQSAFTSAVPVTLDSLQEFRVVTTNATAASGAGGAQVDMITKSGTNQFHGNARWFNRDTFLAANSYFNNANDISNPKLIRNIFGASLGGPVKKDRLFLFLDYEGRTDRSESPTSRVIPSESLKQGDLIYQLDTTNNFNPSAPGVIPCPNGSGYCRELTPTEVANIDPGCTTPGSAGCGENPAMLQLMSLYPVGNSPSLGLDDGLTSTGYRFNAPLNTNNNIYTARLDYMLTANGRHSIFVRGNLADINTDLLPAQFPGVPPDSKLLNNSRSIAVGYTGILTPNLVNTTTYGFIRQGIFQTGGSGPALSAESFSDPSNFTRAVGRTVPTQEIRDDVSWTHSLHTVRFGADLQLPRNHFTTYQNSFLVYNLGDYGYCSNDCRDPIDALESSGQQSVTPANTNAFLEAYMELTGSIPFASGTFTVDPSNGNVSAPSGAPTLRHYAENDFETYVQDTWRALPNLTLSYGLRYSYFGVPWEQNGLQTVSTVNIDQWFAQRVSNMGQGIPADASPLISFIPAGKANHQASWYHPTPYNFAPRLSVAYSPNVDSGLLHKLFGSSGQSAIRAGFGMFYERMGGAIATDQVLNGGDPGLTNSEITPIGQFSLATAPRFSGSCTLAGGCTGLPNPAPFFPSVSSKVTFPYVPDTGVDNFDFIVSQNLRTPYSYDMDLSFERQLSHGVTVEAAYVGNIGQHMIIKKDYGQHLGYFKDNQSGQTLWGAYKQIANLIGPDPYAPQTPISQVAPIAFFQDLMPNLPTYVAGYLGNPDIANMTPTQAFYAIAESYAPDWSDALLALDVPYGNLSPWSATVDPQGDGRVIFGPQFISLPGWSSSTSSNFNSFQLSVRKKTGATTFAANYVFSKSIDISSAAENADLFLSEGQVNGQIANAFDPEASRAVSDFNLKHNFNGTFVVEFPFGRGKKLGGNMPKLLDAAVGGWQLAGTARWRSGFPITPRNGFNYATNEFQPGPGTIIGKLNTSLTRNVGGFPNLFKDPTAVLANSLRFTLPGDPGSRNDVFGPAYFSTDLGLAKTFTMPWESTQKLQLRFEAFNAFNNVNFDSTAGQYGSTYAGALQPVDEFDVSQTTTFGQLLQTAGPRGGAREVQVAVRYDF